MAENGEARLPSPQNGNMHIGRRLLVDELEEAHREINESLAHRSPQLLFIRDFCDSHLHQLSHYNRIIDTDIWTNRNINSLLMITPYYFIIFCDIRVKPQQRHFDFMANKFRRCEDCFYYKGQVPDAGCIILMCAQYVNTRIPVQKINALILPRFQMFERKINSVTYSEAKRYHQAEAEIPDDIVDRFLPRGRGHCCLILLENRLYNSELSYNDVDYSMFREKFFKKLRERYITGRVLWGGRISSFIPGHHEIRDKPFFTGMLIEACSAQFFSATLSGRIDDSGEVTRSKLEAFRDKIRPQLLNHTIGLHLYHETVFDHHTSTIMQVLPEVMVINICLPMNNDAIVVETIFSADSTISSTGQQIKHEDDDMSLLIFTYS